MALENTEIAPPALKESLDDRIVSISLEVNGKVKKYENLFISAVGVKYANPLQDEAEITIYNLDKATQDYILTETSPYNSNYTIKTLILEAGRRSYGTTIIYTGNIIYAGITQPPDIGVVLKCLTGNYLKSTYITHNQPGTSTLQQAANAFTQNAQVILEFQAQNKQIQNYGFSGATLEELEVLAALGNASVFLDSNTLVITDKDRVRDNIFIPVSSETGMVGIPELTERGVRIKMFVNPRIKIGGGVTLTSRVNPTLNGNYIIYQLAFIITNRLIPFYYVVDAYRPPQFNYIEDAGG